jgi:isopenicillin N synthase-like dioxygenase
MRKDDFVGNAEPLPCHEMVKKDWDVFKQYVADCRAAIDLMITILETHLQLPKGTLANLHRITSRSGDHVRFNQTASRPWSDEQEKKGEHTDFGTLTILMNWMGGLQIRLPETKEWVYVKPIPGSAVVNLGDALVKFTAGILRSNVHRVVPAPPPQAGRVRNSLVYFSRPEDEVVLKRLKGGLIDLQPQDEEEKGAEMTAQEWTLRRSVGDLRGVYTHKGGLELKPSLMAVEAK